MKFNGRMQFTGVPIANLATGTLEKIFPRSEINHFASGERICTVPQHEEFAFLVLSGRCQEICSAADAAPQILKTFERGDPIKNGVLGQPGSDQVAIVATEDCTILRIRHTDLADLGCDLNGESASSDSTIIPVAECVARPVATTLGRVLTFALAQPQSSANAIARSLARALHEISREPVALICLSPCATGCDSNRADLDLVLDQPHCSNELIKYPNGLNVVHVGVPKDFCRTGVLVEMAEELRRRFPYVLFAGPARELPIAVLHELLSQSHPGYLLSDRTDDNLSFLDQLARSLRPQGNARSPNPFQAVLCLHEGETVGDFDERLLSVGIPVAGYVHGDNGGDRFNADLRRLARQFSGRQVGLALASGGAKGFAHIGVIQVLEENGIEVDMIAGSSMGAYVGSIWAHGETGPEMEALAREMEGRWAIWSLIDPVFPPRRGFLRGLAVKRRLMRTIGEACFGDLVRPLRVVATNLETLDRTVFAHGGVAAAVHASIAVPGICVPVVVGEATYADGGIVDPLPVEALREAGVHRIIAVNTIPTPERMRAARQARRARNRENSPHLKENSSKILPFDQHLNYFARGNILEVLMRSFLGAQTRMAEVACLRANVVLRPDIDDNRWVDFRNPEQYIRAGREVALQQLDEIKALIRDQDVSHETKSNNETLAAVG